jgi:hypothetical protein
LGAKAAIEGSRPRSLIPGGGPGSESQPRSDGVARSTQRGDGGRSALAPAPSRRWGGGEAAPQAASLPLHRARECSLVKLRRGQQNQFHRARSPLSVDQTRRGAAGGFPTSVGAIAHAWSESRLKSSRASAESERPPSWARGTRSDFVHKGTGGDMARDHARRRRAIAARRA